MLLPIYILLWMFSSAFLKPVQNKNNIKCNSLLAIKWQFLGKLSTLVSFDKSGGAQPTPPSGKKVMDMLMIREPGGAA